MFLRPLGCTDPTNAVYQVSDFGTPGVHSTRTSWPNAIISTLYQKQGSALNPAALYLLKVVLRGSSSLEVSRNSSIYGTFTPLIGSIVQYAALLVSTGAVHPVNFESAPAYH